MIDWFNVFSNSLWVGGLALILSGFNLAIYRHNSNKQPFFKTVQHTWQSGWVRTGRLLTCLGMLLNSASWVEAGLWALLAASVLYEWGWQYRFISQQSLTQGVNSGSQTSEVNTFWIAFPSEEKKPPNRRFTLPGKILERGRIIWLAALLPTFIFGQGHYLLYGVVGLLLLAGVTILLNRPWWRKSPVDFSLLLWLLLIPVTLSITTSLTLTAEFLGYFLAELLAFYGISSWASNERRLRWGAWGLVGLGVGLALLSPFLIQRQGRFFFLPVALTLPEIHSSLIEAVNPNVLGGTLAILLPLSFGLVLSQFSTGNRLVWLLLGRGLACSALILVGVGLILTQSRGAFIGAGLGLGLMVVLKWGKPWWILVGISLAIFGFAYIGLNDHSLSFLETLIRSDQVEGLDTRLEIWSRAISAIQAFPFTGVGLGTAKLVVPTLLPYFLASSPGPDGVIPHAHNLFLQISLDLGLPGFISFLSLILTISKLGLSNWHATRNRELGYIILGSLGALFTMLTHGLVDAVSWGTKPAWIAWAVMGLLLAASLQAEKSSHTRKPLINSSALFQDELV